MSMVALLLMSGLCAGAVHVGEAPLLAPAASSLSFVGIDAVSQPFESHLRQWTKTGVRGGGRWIRRGVRLVIDAAKTWLRWLARAIKFVIIAAFVAFAEGQLLSAWRREGLRPLRTYLPLVLYVYVSLLSDGRVGFRGKLLLLLSIAYGVVSGDLIADRVVLPGLIDDVLVIALALHLFRKSCDDAVIDHWARRAVEWQERVATLSGA